MSQRVPVQQIVVPLIITDEERNKFLDSAGSIREGGWFHRGWKTSSDFSELKRILEDKYEARVRAIKKSVDSEGRNALQLSASYGTLQGSQFLVEKHGFNASDGFLLAVLEGKLDQVKGSP